MKILVLSPISTDALQLIRSQHSVRAAWRDESSDEWPDGDAEVVIVRSGVELDSSRLEAMPSLRAVIRAGSGLDSIDTNHLRARGIPIFRLNEFHANAVAELAFALLLTLSRGICLLDREMRKGNWIKNQVQGTEMQGKVLGIVGLGRIGERLAALAQPWGMRIVAVARTYSTARREGLRIIGVELESSMERLAESSDMIVVALPLTPETELIISDSFLSAMKPTAFLVNVGRGRTIDEDALDRALTQRRIAGAALDVHSSEGAFSRFASFDNVVLLPHVGSNTVETQTSIGKAVVETLEQISKT